MPPRLEMAIDRQQKNHLRTTHPERSGSTGILMAEMAAIVSLVLR